MEGPLVSVVIPTHNRKEFLLAAVESCLGQTWRNIEVVIVDDGSSDGTRGAITQRLGSASLADRVRYVYQENRGASAARNHGLRLARGDYVQFLDSDDLLRPTKIATQLEPLEKRQNLAAACCYCYGWMGVISNGSALTAGGRIGIGLLERRALIRELCSKVVHGMQTSAPLWRRAFLVSRPGWLEEISLGQDLEYYVRLLVDAREVCFVDDELFVVREHGGDRLSAFGPTVASVSSFLKTRRSVYQSVKRAGLWDEYTQKAFLGAMRTIYANALAAGDAEITGDLERWLWDLASAPRRRLGFQAMICARRFLGGQFLLSTHRVVKRLRAG